MSADQGATSGAAVMERLRAWRERPTLAELNRLQQANGNGDTGQGDGGEEPTAAAATPKKAHKWRRRVKRVALVVAVLMIPVVWSYVGALTGPGSDSVQARTVEWARDHHLGWVVDIVEKRYYASHQAKVGGTPTQNAEALHLVAKPATDAAAAATTAVATTVAPGDTTSTAAAPAPAGKGAVPNPPAPLKTPADTPVANEGKWQGFGPIINGTYGTYATLIRPDNVHTSVLDAVIYFDPTRVSFRQYPGTKIPGAPWDRPDYVEAARQRSLIAAFSSGFRIQDSNGGMILGGTTLRAMRNGGATFVVDKNGKPNIGIWGRDFTSGAGLDSARQNLDLLVDNGQPNPALTTDANRKWGFTGPANKQAVWRSGAGIRADGALVWVGGNGLTVSTLADLLIRAGAVRGMQLDINQEWVQFNTYSVGANGQVSGQRILSGMSHTGNRYLTEDTRDFFAVFAR